MNRILSKSKQRVLAFILIIGSSVVTLFTAEFVLKYYREYIAGSDQRDPHMIGYDATLGWKLAPDWSGRHSHFDFNVRYETNQHGFRGEFVDRHSASDRIYAVVGDSFTFSYGVNEGETFIDLLNTTGRNDGDYFYNFGVPGYSTDQELLLITDRVFSFEPDVIYLVVYLFNDLIDNQRAYPIQSAHAKPYFEPSPSGLQLRNVPVPAALGKSDIRHHDIGGLILGDKGFDKGVVVRALGRFELTRLLLPYFETSTDIREHLESALDDAMSVFEAIISEIHAQCSRRGIELRLVLMPGRTYVEQPGSLSAQYQDYLREKILQHGEKRDIVTMDLAMHLRALYEKHGMRLYHPNEGHLNVDGHAAVADFLRNSPDTTYR